ncbi:MAG: Hpt domain-containing protein [Planctomycetaceae bacterium]|nr:Hpt domain-containing protein [Planctomycetaceae bacterium]
MSTELPLDVAVILEQSSGQIAVAEMILDEFTAQIPDDVANIEANLSNGDFLAASKSAHRLKGSAGTLGGKKLYTLCTDVELAGKEGRGDDMKKLFEDLKVEAELCKEAIPAVKAAIGC